VEAWQHVKLTGTNEPFDLTHLDPTRPVDGRVRGFERHLRWRACGPLELVPMAEELALLEPVFW
jgi:hypothetical protein